MCSKIFPQLELFSSLIDNVLLSYNILSKCNLAQPLDTGDLIWWRCWWETLGPDTMSMASCCLIIIIWLEFKVERFSHQKQLFYPDCVNVELWVCNSEVWNICNLLNWGREELNPFIDGCNLVFPSLLWSHNNLTNQARHGWTFLTFLELKVSGK